VFVLGTHLGKTGDKLTANCGDKHVRVGKIVGQHPTGVEGAMQQAVQWRSPGKIYSIACKKVTAITIELQ